MLCGCVGVAGMSYPPYRLKFKILLIVFLAAIVSPLTMPTNLPFVLNTGVPLPASICGRLCLPPCAIRAGRMRAETVSHSMPFTAIVGKPTARASPMSEAFHGSRASVATPSGVLPSAVCSSVSPSAEPTKRSRVRTCLPSSVR